MLIFRLRLLIPFFTRIVLVSFYLLSLNPNPTSFQVVLNGNCTILRESRIHKCWTYSTCPCSRIACHRATPRMGGALHWPSVCAPPLSLLTTALLGVLNFGWARFALVSIGLSDYGALKLAWPALTHWRCPVRGIGMVCYHSRKIEAVGKATLSITRMGEVSEHP